jgi:hypothetical protein
VIWEAVLPLRSQHKLSDEAVVQLVELCRDAPVRFGQPLGEEGRPDREREGERDLIGRCTGAEPAEDNRVHVVLDLDQLGDLDGIVGPGLLDGSLGIGLDAQVRGPGPDADGERLIHEVRDLRCLAVVPTDREPEYVDEGPAERPSERPSES